MARFDTSFDATSVEPTTPYELLPAGKYSAQIVESEMRVTRNGMGQFLWMMLDILDGPYKGRKIFDQLNLVNPNPTTVEIAQRTLSAICHATDGHDLAWRDHRARACWRAKRAHWQSQSSGQVCAVIPYDQRASATFELAQLPLGPRLEWRLRREGHDRAGCLRLVR